MTFTARVYPPQMIQALALAGGATWSSLLMAVEGDASVREQSRETFRLLPDMLSVGPC
ncbi:hypothetical protein [Pseudomonas zeae]|uniref:Uncharacterized protein n=1 Tax=Pseudomonas zeae TaxID=2745510 RepID=A0ABU5BN05_9PSED|nr:hypothetical protein [Pseudomonas zeae]MDX9678061.1 hypothetical protein [Pseudomonas zeae]